ncbi:hypothetical protein ABIE56_000200 [Luteibacter sp. 621]|uniref:hypothetical protein n=1 Tax=Luteibacter sp. 621 TaxID=3373916 RepID=UPI003D1EDBC4
MDSPDNTSRDFMTARSRPTPTPTYDRGNRIGVAYTGKASDQIPMEARVTLLESTLEYVRRDLDDVRGDIREIKHRVGAIECAIVDLSGTLRAMYVIHGARIDGLQANAAQKIDGVEERLTARIDSVEEKLTARIDGVEEKLTARIDGVEEKLTARIDGVEQRLSDKIDGVRDCLQASLNARIDGVRDSLQADFSARFDGFQQLITARFDSMEQRFARYPTKLQLSLWITGGITAALAATLSFIALLLRMTGHGDLADAVDIVGGN